MRNFFNDLSEMTFEGVVLDFGAGRIDNSLDNILDDFNALSPIANAASSLTGTGLIDIPLPNFDMLTGSAGYDIPTLDFAESSNLTFTLNNTGGVEPGTNAEAGFLAAVALWQSFLGDDVNITLDVGFSNLGAGILGSAGSSRAIVTYAVFRDALIADGTSPDDATAIANLELSNSLDFATQDQNGVFILDDNDTINNTQLRVNTATLRAVGITQDIDGNPLAATDASISFNNTFTWDFDPTDGIDAGAIDFVGVAFHEIGHALGFVSGVDLVDINSTLDLNPFAIFSALDLFRYSDNSQTMFGAGTRDLGYGGTTYFSIDGGATNLALFSTGSQNGDGRQASHWKDNLGIGIMDPTSAPAGTANIITMLDIMALDVIGWDLVAFGAATAVSLFDETDTLVDIYDSIQEAEDAAADGYRIEIDAGTYAENPEAVTTDLDNLTLDLPAGVTPTITMTGTSTTLTLTGLGDGGVVGNSLNNIITGNDGDNTIDGGAGDDTLEGGAGLDVIDGGAGFDTASFASSSAGVTVFNDGTTAGLGGDAAGEVYTSIEAFIGSAFDDQLVFNGPTQDNIAFGGDGDDRIRSRDGGNETFHGEGGDDRLFGGTGNDQLFGGDGEDDLFGGAGNDFLDGGSGDNSRDVLIAGAGNDFLYGYGGNDALRGNTGNDMLFGGDGDDGMEGGSGVDELYGGNGNDTLLGEGGQDILDGGFGNDRMTGGSSADTFIFDLGYGTDRIVDFNFGAGDVVDLSGFGLANYAAVVALMTQTGTDARINFGTGETLIFLDFDIGDFSAADFILGGGGPSAGSAKAAQDGFIKSMASLPAAGFDGGFDIYAQDFADIMDMDVFL